MSRRRRGGTTTSGAAVAVAVSVCHRSLSCLDQLWSRSRARDVAPSSSPPPPPHFPGRSIQQRFDLECVHRPTLCSVSLVMRALPRKRSTLPAPNRSSSCLQRSREFIDCGSRAGRQNALWMSRAGTKKEELRRGRFRAVATRFRCSSRKFTLRRTTPVAPCLFYRSRDPAFTSLQERPKSQRDADGYESAVSLFRLVLRPFLLLTKKSHFPPGLAAISMLEYVPLRRRKFTYVFAWTVLQKEEAAEMRRRVSKPAAGGGTDFFRCVV